VIDCPVTIDVDLFAWLELSSRHLAWKGGPPSFFWIEEPKPRLLLSLGPVAGQLLVLLANAELDNPRLWPLSTSRPAAIDAAKKALSGKLDPFGDGTTATLGQLIEVLGSA
jgi:type VI secretion system protein ImpM